MNENQKLKLDENKKNENKKENKKEENKTEENKTEENKNENKTEENQTEKNKLQKQQTFSEKKKNKKQEIAKEFLQDKLEKILGKLKSEKYKNLDNFIEDIDKEEKGEENNNLMSYDKSSEESKKNEEKNKKCDFFIQFFATFFNLISVYQIITIMNSLFQIVKEDFLGRFIKENKKTFFEHIVYDTFKNIPELEIEFWSSMIGSIILENLKIEISSFILFVINLGCLICLNLFPFHKEEDLQTNYSVFELVELAIFYSILFLSVGGGSLFYYQKFIYFFEKCSNFGSTSFIFIISSASMISRIGIDYLIIYLFDYKVNKLKFSFWYFFVYVIFFLLSLGFQFWIDYRKKEEIFTLKCDSCKCCKNRCRKKPKNPVTVLRKKVNGYRIFGSVYYEEKYEKTEIEKKQFNKELDYAIVNVDNVIPNIKNTELYDDDYSIKIIFKRENLCDWLCEIFSNPIVYLLFFLNILISLQVIGFTNLYSEVLENMTYKENSKELAKYVASTGFLGFIVNVSLLVCIGSKEENNDSKCRRGFIVTYLVYIIGLFNFYGIITSFFRYFNKLPKNFSYYYLWNMVLYSSLKVFWVNFFSQQNAKDFLNYTGLFSLGNIISGLLSIIFIDKLEYSIKSLMIIQLISAFISIILLVIMIVIFCYKDKYFKIIDEDLFNE